MTLTSVPGMAHEWQFIVTGAPETFDRKLSRPRMVLPLALFPEPVSPRRQIVMGG